MTDKPPAAQSLVEMVAQTLDPDAWSEVAERALDDAARVGGVTFDAMPWAVRRKRARDKAAEVNAVFLDAIAEPSEAMIAAGEMALFISGPSVDLQKTAAADARLAYRAMIAALPINESDELPRRSCRNHPPCDCPGDQRCAPPRCWVED